MAEAFVQVAPDSTGAKLHTISKTVGANTVHNQVVHPQSPRTRTGLYFGTSGVITLAATADTAPAGRVFLVNPVGSTKAIAVKRVKVSTQTGSAVALVAPAVIVASRITFTGAAGTAITPGLRVRTTTQGQTADATQAGTFGVTAPGTASAGQDIRTFLSVTQITATVGGGPPSIEVWDPDEEDSEIILAAGEGLAFRLTTTTTGETRRLVVDIAWEEFTTP